MINRRRREGELWKLPILSGLIEGRNKEDFENFGGPHESQFSPLKSKLCEENVIVDDVFTILLVNATIAPQQRWRKWKTKMNGKVKMIFLVMFFSFFSYQTINFNSNIFFLCIYFILFHLNQTTFISIQFLIYFSSFLFLPILFDL